jgi:trimethylamine--corrinoid protein Co-methyltransferase
MIPTLRPTVKLLSDDLAEKIIDEAFQTLSRVGIAVQNQEAAQLLLEGGARSVSSSSRVCIPQGLVETALRSAPEEFAVYDSPGSSPLPIGGNTVHFDPGSAALRIFDHAAQTEREPVTADLIKFSRLTQLLENFHLQSTGLISSDVPKEIADCYRLFVALQYSAKPIVTGTFIVDGFRPMLEMLAAVRGGTKELGEKPLAIFDACPSPPLKWSNLTAQSVIDCARAGIPSEFVAMPLTGATAPATLTGALVQHVAENLSGLVISQIAMPGAPVVFGGSPAGFDMRSGTPPMGAMETMMLDSAYSQIGKRLALPTHAYMGLSDAKCVDAQAGLESALGAVLAGLSGINVVSGGGMMDFESCQSLEKLVIDNEICGLVYRLLTGINQREDPIALDLFSALGEDTDFLTHEHTLAWYRREHALPRIIDRGNQHQWEEDGKPTLSDRASGEVEHLVSQETEYPLDANLRNEIRIIMQAHARHYGCDQLPITTGA